MASKYLDIIIADGCAGLVLFSEPNESYALGSRTIVHLWRESKQCTVIPKAQYLQFLAKFPSRADLAKDRGIKGFSVGDQCYLVVTWNWDDKKEHLHKFSSNMPAGYVRTILQDALGLTDFPALTQAEFEKRNADEQWLSGRDFLLRPGTQSDSCTPHYETGPDGHRYAVSCVQKTDWKW